MEGLFYGCSMQKFGKQKHGEAVSTTSFIGFINI